MRFTAANFLVFFALPLNMNSVTMTFSLKETTHHNLLRDEERATPASGKSARHMMSQRRVST